MRTLKPFNLLLSDAQRLALTRLAKKRHVSVAVLIREAIDTLLTSTKRPS